MARIPARASDIAASTFDTLKAVRDMEAAGVETPQAEAIATAIRDGQNDLATKADVSMLQWSFNGSSA